MSYHTLILLSMFISSECQTLFKNWRCVISPLLEMDEIESLRSHVIRLQDEKATQDNHVKNLENALIAFVSKYERDTREQTNEIELFRNKMKDIEEKIIIFDAKIDSVQRYQENLDKVSNMTTAVTTKLTDGLDILSQKVKGLERNMTSTLSMQNNRENETKQLVIRLSGSVRDLESLSNKSAYDIEEINRSTVLMNDIFETKLNKLEENIKYNISNCVRKFESLGDKLDRNLTKAFITLDDVSKNFSERCENLEQSNERYIISTNNLQKEMVDMNRRVANYSSFLLQIHTLMSIQNGSFSSLELIGSGSENSNDSLLFRVSSLEKRKDGIMSTIDILKKTTETLHVRLANGGSYYGRVEVYIFGKGWGTVCDDNFGSMDAIVLCRQLGFRSGFARQSAYYGEGSVDIIMDDVDCSGSERAIQQCSYISNHNCGHSEDVSVDCSY